MYEDEKEEVIHDTLESAKDVDASLITEHLLVRYLRAFVQEEIAKKFDEQPTSYNSFKKEEMETLVENMLDRFLESNRFESMVIDIVKNVLDDSYIDISTTAYITH